MLDLIKTQLNASCLAKQRLIEDPARLADIEAVAESCIAALRQGKKLLLAGNGGSAADSQHIAAELVGRFEKDRAGLPALALTTNASSMTAIANDYGYDSVFSRQIQAFANGGDVFVGFSTSGDSPNIVSAVEEAKRMGLITVGMTGNSGGKLVDICDHCIRVPDTNTARIQESHITIGHIICSLIEQAIFPDV